MLTTATVRSPACTAALLVLVTLLPRAAHAADYRLQAESSELIALVFKAGPASALAHDHVVRATRFSGTLRGEPAQPASASVDVTVAVDGLLPDEPEMRRKHGLAGLLSDSDRAKIQETMLGSTQLDVATHPTITFRSTRVEPVGEDRFLVSGNFTLHGVTRLIAVSVEVQRSGSGLRATGAFDITQTDFGLHPFSAFLGAVRNQDRVHVRFDLIAAE